MRKKLTTNGSAAVKHPARRVHGVVGSKSNRSGQSKPGSTTSSRKAKKRCSTRQPGQASRQRPQPVSHALTKDMIVNVLAGLLHAEHIGVAPTHMITINWEQAGVTDGVRATGRFLKLYKDAAASRGWLTCHVWVRETGACHGDHVHILLHIPPGNAGWLAKRKAGWLAKCGASRMKGVSHTGPIIGRPLTQTPFETVSDLYQANLDAVARYILKHCTSAIATAFGIRPNGGCTVKGKRVSISENLSQKARAACDLCDGG